MNRQQAPGPVVRPLIEVQSEAEVAALLDGQTAVGGKKELCAALNGYAVVLELTDSVMSAFVMVCQETGAGYYVAETDNIEVITPLIELTCSTEVIEEDTINRELQGIVNYISYQGGWTFGVFNIYERIEYPDLSLTCRKV